MKKDSKVVLRSGFSGPVETVSFDGVHLHKDAKICLMVTIPEKRCGNGCFRDRCVHVSPALYHDGFYPTIIERRVGYNQQGDVSGVCIKEKHVPRRQSLDPSVCFNILKPGTKPDPVCTFLAHILAEEALVEFRNCERQSYSYVTMSLFTRNTDKLVINIIRNYWIPLMFRPEYKKP